MSQQYKRNHYVPKALLKYWSSSPPDRAYRGVWLYDIAEGRKYFANAQGSGAFEFAVGEDLYVPIIGGKRATALERWLSQLEGHLDRLVSQIHERAEQIIFRQRADIIAALRALFSLECRSPFNVQQLQQAIRESPRTREVLAETPGGSVHQLILENLVNYATEYSLRFANGRMLLMHTKSGGVILSDRPAVNHPDLAPRFFAVTSNVIVGLEEQSPMAQFVYKYEPLNQEFLDLLNKRIALEARHWIAAMTEPLLDKYVEVIQSDEWRQYRASERVRIEPVMKLTAGWSIPPEDAKG